ncbi:MAG: 3-keto-disaccharide hydrolase, partial [Planctomycetaceae bacterium]
MSCFFWPVPSMLLVTSLLVAAAVPVSAEESADGFQPIFDGRSLEQWDGDPNLWRVEDGAITGRTTDEDPIEHNTFLIWRGGEVGDFELKLEYRIDGGNSGIQYRSFEAPDQKWVVGGYQADFEAGDRYSGILYGERFRGILADRGQKTELVREDGKFKVNVTDTFGDSKEIQTKIKKGDWNEYHVIARGFHFIHMINGVKTAECIDNDEQMRRKTGILALQLHRGPAMKVQFRNIRLKRLPAEEQQSRGVSPRSDHKQIIFIAGKRSHGYGAHEHRAGCMLLASALNESGLPVEAEVITEGWPQDDSALDQADAIIIYADGGGGHPAIQHLDRLKELAAKGIGIGCIHYAVEVPKGEPGDALLDTIGGYFELNWSVNP